MKNNIKYSLLSIVLTSLVLGGIFSLANLSVPINPSSTEQTLKYGNTVCIYKNSNLVECKNNLFTDRGRNYTRDVLNVQAATFGRINAIALGNTSETIGAANTTVQNEFTAANTGCGLQRAAGTFGTSTNATGFAIGNWSYYNQFTSTCTINVNVTGVFNTTTQGQAGESLFAVTTFTTVTLASSDTLNVTWYMWVS